MRYFVLCDNNRWADDSDLLEVFRKANLINPCLSYEAQYTEALNDFLHNNAGALHEHVDFCEREWMEPEKKVNIVLYVYDDESWKLYDVCDFTGQPSWNWIGKGEKPEIPYLQKHKLTIQEDGKPEEWVDWM